MSSPRWSQGKKQGEVGPPGCLVTVAQGWCRTSQAQFLEEGTDPSAHLRPEAVPARASGSSGGARGRRLARDEAGSRDVQAAVIGVGYPGRAGQGDWASGGLGNRGRLAPTTGGITRRQDQAGARVVPPQPPGPTWGAGGRGWLGAHTRGWEQEVVPSGRGLRRGAAGAALQVQRSAVRAGGQCIRGGERGVAIEARERQPWGQS